MAQISLMEVSKSWGDKPALDSISVQAPAGQLLALLGPSGCGKSTTLRLIAGLEFADRGHILIGERDVTRLPAAQRRIAMVFQTYALFPHLSVAENIVFGLAVRRIDPAERARRLAEAVELLGLDGLLDRKPAQLSGGQRQRVALGRAIVARAQVCLMDEPLSNLDAQLRAQMRSEIRALQQRLGMTMVYVTHDQTEAMTMADRVVLMRHGRIEQCGAPAELYDTPATAFAASFIGAPPMNLLAGDRVSRSSHETLGVRPEHLELIESSDAVPARDRMLEARVTAVEYLGAESMVTCVASGDSALVVRAPGRARVALGAAVMLAWNARDEHRFDAKSGVRLAA